MQSKSDFLLIEDNLIDQFVIKKLLLKVLDINPLFIANNGKEGLEWLRENNNFSTLTILLDIQMPIMNGFEFLNEFNNLEEDIKNKIEIFVLSSTLDLDEIKRIKEDKNVSDFWNKPLQIEVLQKSLINLKYD